MSKRECKDAALKFLSLSDKTAREVEKYLLGLEYPAEEVANTLKFLEEFRYVNDYEYCLKYMRYALLGKKRGVLGTKNKLQEKGIAGDLFEDALHEFMAEEDLPSEKERAAEVADKLCGEKQPDDRLLGKVARRLIYMGYEKDAVYEAIGRLMNYRRSEFNE